MTTGHTKFLQDILLKKTLDDIGGELLAGSGFEDDQPDAGFTNRAPETEPPPEDAPSPDQ